MTINEAIANKGMALSSIMFEHALTAAWDEDPVYLAYQAGVMEGVILCQRLGMESGTDTLLSYIREYENDDRFAPSKEDA